MTPTGRLFNPASIALVGATDKSGWSVNTFANLRLHGFTGPVHLVNPHTDVVHDEAAYRTLSDVPGPVDLVYVMVPTAVVPEILAEGARLGIRDYVILTAGFGETGAEGLRREAELAAFSRAHGLTVLGPNGNGFINAAAAITPYGHCCCRSCRDPSRPTLSRCSTSTRRGRAPSRRRHARSSSSGTC